MSHRKTVFWCLTCMLLSLLPVSVAQVTPDKVDVLVIDPGHGGKDPGCHGKTALEKDIVLSVAKKFGKLVKEKYPDVKVVYTRSDDRFVELWKRGQIANDNHADLFVSIHCNAVDNSSAKGTETWLRGSQKNAANLAEVQRENAVIYQEQNHEANYSQSWLDVLTATVHQDAGFENSIYFADELQALYKSRIPSSPNRGIKQGPFYVLWKSARPSVLTELGFLSNPAEEKFLSSEAGQDKVAGCLLDAFSKYKARIDSRSAGASDPAKPGGDSGTVPSKPAVAGKGEEPRSPSKEGGAAASLTTQRVESAPIEPSGEEGKGGKPEIVFKVQIAASGNRLELKPYNFKGLEALSFSYDNARKLYRYYYSRASSYEEIQKALEKARAAGYGSAFVVAFRNGQAVSVQEALDLSGR